jgi:hypothetical protein
VARVAVRLLVDRAAGVPQAHRLELDSPAAQAKEVYLAAAAAALAA